MRIFLSIIFLFSASIIYAQKPAETVTLLKTAGGKYQFVNKQTRVPVDSMLWDEAGTFANGFAKVYHNKKFSLINESGKPIALVEFDAVRSFSNKLCAVKKDGKWGFIDETGKPVIPFKYEIVFDFTYPTVTAVFGGKKWYLISNKDVIIKELDITTFSGFNKNGIAKVTKQNSEGKLYADGKLVWSPAKSLTNNQSFGQPAPNNLSVPCPDNIGFEFGDFTNWECFIGTVADVGGINEITVVPSPPVMGRHTIISKQAPSAKDFYGGFDLNAPDGSNFVVRLGDSLTGADAERIRYTIHVPLNDSTFSLKYDYAVVFENPLNHDVWEQPRFVSRLVDSATGNAIGCASLEFVATAGLPGFNVSPIPSNSGEAVLYKPWSSVFYSLRGYGGQTLYLEFTTADCTLSGHWGYAYVDVQSTCGSPVETHYECVAPNAMTLTAPPGFQFYNWWNSDFSTLLGTGQVLNMNPGLPVGSIAWVEIVPFNSFGCLDTLLVNLNGTFDAEFDLTNPGGCGTQTYTFYSRNLLSTSTTWDFGDGDTATGDTVTHTYSIPGSYQVTMDVIMPGGCIGNDIKLITIYPPPNMVLPADRFFCNNENSSYIGFTGTPPGMVYNWVNTNPSIGLPASGSGDINSFVPINTGTTPVTASITVTPNHLTCTGPPQTFTITVNPSPDMTTVPVSQALCNGATTNAITFTPTLSGTTFNWTNSDPSIGLPANGTGDIAAFTAINTGTVPVTAAIRITPTNGICSGIERLVVIRVNPTPDVLQPGNINVCQNSATGAINFSGAVAGTIFNWANDNPSIGLAANGTGNIPSFNGVNTGTVPQTGVITVSPVAFGCPGSAKTFTLTVKPTPVAFFQPGNQILCNGSVTSPVYYSSFVSGTTFNWTNNNTSIGLAASGTGDISPFNVVNTTNAPVTATITVIPTADGCPGSSGSFTITVNPTPNVADPADQNLCNGEATNAINYTGAVSGTLFSWANDNTSIGLAASGTGNIPSFTATNTSSAPVTATITVTPSANGCPGAVQSFTITVNPTPNVVDAADQVLCNNEPTSGVNFTGAVSGTLFSWVNDNTSIGLAASGSGDIPSFTATNTTNVPITATITVAPSANGCNGTAQSFTITVNPTPDVVDAADQVLCNNEPTSAVNFTGAVPGTVFTWSNNNTSIGLAANGVGDIPSFTATNVSNAPETATITITPSANGCTGTAQSFTIIVSPTPDVVQPNHQVRCNGVATSPTNFLGFVIGTTFNWVNDNTSIGLAANGSGNIPSFTATNITNAPITATITVTPTANGCTGSSKSFTIRVNPSADVVLPGNQTLCNGSATTAINFTGSVSGSAYSWTNDNAAIGLVTSGVGDIPSFTAINVTNAPITATITITPTASACAGTVQSFTITVNPTPDVLKPADQILCNNATTTAVGFTGAVSGTGYSWTNDNTSIGLAANGNGDIPSFTAINTTNIAATANIIVAPSANGCPGPSQNFTIVVNPTPDVLQPTDQKVCDQIKTNAVIFSGAVAGTSFNWTNSAPSIGLASSGIGNIGAFYGNNTSSSPVSATITVTPVAKGCAGLPKTTVIRIDPNPTADLGANLFLSTGTITNLNATIQNGPITNWAWTPATGLSCTNCPSPELKVTNDITYHLVVTNVYGCVGQDNISISTFCKNSQVFVPNAFTPDGDGLNDILMVRGKGIFVTSFRIFNRWGEMVFYKTNFNPNDKQFGWDGRVRGIPANADVFVFTAEVICDNGVKYTYKGNTTLLK